MRYDPTEAIRHLESRNPAATMLAEAASLATIVDAALCRELRTTLTGGGPDAEADLYFSEVVSDRSPAGFMIEPQAAAILRERLAADSERLAKAWQLISARHDTVSPAIRTEEQLQFHALSGDFLRVTEILRQCVAALVDPERVSFSAWAIDAIERLDPRVREIAEYKMLGIGAAMRTGAADETLARLVDDRLQDWLSWLMPVSIENREIGVQLAKGGVEFGPVTQMRYEHRMSVPGPLPALVTVRTPAGETRHVQLREDRRLFVPLLGDEFVISSADGRKWLLRPKTTGERSSKTRIKHKLVISYDVETAGGQTTKELPFVVGVIGDFAGDAVRKGLPERRFIRVEQIDQTVARIEPSISISVDNLLDNANNKPLAVELRFRAFKDFEPDRIVEQVEPLRRIIDTRNTLRDLMAKVDNSEQLESLLKQILTDESKIGALRAQVQDPKRRAVESQATLDVVPPFSKTASPHSTLLDQVINATKGTEPRRVEDLMRTLTNEAMTGAVHFREDLAVTLREAIAKIDAKISEQLAAIMHHEKFKKIERSWYGLNYIVTNSEIGDNLKIQILDITKEEIARDFEEATDFTRSTMFKKIYDEQFGVVGGQPFGCIIGDFSFSNHPDDIDLLTNISRLAAAGFTPFIAAASSKLLGMDSFKALLNPKSLKQIFEATEYLSWNGFRSSEDSRFVALTVPRVLARLPYGTDTKRIEKFAYEEVPRDASHAPKAMDHDDYCWMNAAYALGACISNAFAQYGWCTMIHGAEGGGKVTNLPLHVFKTDEGDLDAQCPTEIGITDRREKELSDLGLSPLCHYKDTDYAVFFGAQTTHKPKNYDSPNASANAKISARLPYVMAISRFAHYIKVLARDKIGSFMEVEDCEKWLNQWITSYVAGREDADQETRAKYPLHEARVEVREVEGSPGRYSAVAYLRPSLQFEELTTSMRITVDIPRV